jgi:hypothetical protein
MKNPDSKRKPKGDSRGFLPSERDFEDLIAECGGDLRELWGGDRAEIKAEIGSHIERAFEELLEAVDPDQNEVFLREIQNLSELVSAEDAGKSFSRILESVKLETGKKIVDGTSHLLLLGESMRLIVTSNAAKLFLQLAERVDGGIESSLPHEKGGSAGRSVSLLHLAFCLGQRISSKKHTGDMMRALPMICRGLEMTGGVGGGGSRVRREHQKLREWIRSIVLNFKKTTGEFPSRKQLEGLLRTHLAEEEKRSCRVSENDRAPDGKRRLRHRDDQSGKGVTWTTITETWLTEIKKANDA